MEPANTLHGESWGGKAFQLSRPEKGSRQLSAALFSILSHRWLPTLRYVSRTTGAAQTDRSQRGGYGGRFGMFRSSTFRGMLDQRQPHPSHWSFNGRHVPTVSRLLGAPRTSRYPSPLLFVTRPLHQFYSCCANLPEREDISPGYYQRNPNVGKSSPSIQLLSGYPYCSGGLHYP